MNLNELRVVAEKEIEEELNVLVKNYLKNLMRQRESLQKQIRELDVELKPHDFEYFIEKAKEYDSLTRRR